MFLVLALGTPDPTGAFGFRGGSAVYALAYATVGLLIVLRRPEHPVGWMMLVAGGLLAAVQQVAEQYARYTVLGSGELPGGDVAAGLLVTVTFLVYGVVYGISNTGPAVDLLEVVFVITVMAFAASFGIAILKFRLFDVDVVVSRAVVFGLLAAFITVVYVGLVVWIGALVESRGHAVLSAVAAALVAIAFQLVRRRAQRVANRLVYGERATPYEVLSEFGRRVSEGYGSEDVLVRMARPGGPRTARGLPRPSSTATARCRRWTARRSRCRWCTRASCSARSRWRRRGASPWPRPRNAWWATSPTRWGWCCATPH